MESIVADRGDGLWQDHRGDTVTSIESTVADLGDGMLQCNARNPRLVQIQPTSYWLIESARKGKGTMDGVL